MYLYSTACFEMCRGASKRRVRYGRGWGRSATSEMKFTSEARHEEGGGAKKTKSLPVLTSPLSLAGLNQGQAARLQCDQLSQCFTRIRQIRPWTCCRYFVGVGA